MDPQARVPVPRCRRCQMPTCDNCDAHVSRKFARVFADEHGNIHACPDCAANAGISEVSRRRARNA